MTDFFIGLGLGASISLLAYFKKQKKEIQFKREKEEKFITSHIKMRGIIDEDQERVVELIISNLSCNEQLCSNARFNPLDKKVIFFEEQLIKAMEAFFSSMCGSEMNPVERTALGILKGVAYRFYSFEGEFERLCTLPHILNFILLTKPEELIKFLEGDSTAKELAKAYIQEKNNKEKIQSFYDCLVDRVKSTALDDGLCYLLSGDDFLFRGIQSYSSNYKIGKLSEKENNKGLIFKNNNIIFGEYVMDEGRRGNYSAVTDLFDKRTLPIVALLESIKITDKFEYPLLDRGENAVINDIRGKVKSINDDCKEVILKFC